MASADDPDFEHEVVVDLLRVDDLAEDVASVLRRIRVLGAAQRPEIELVQFENFRSEQTDFEVVLVGNAAQDVIRLSEEQGLDAAIGMHVALEQQFPEALDAEIVDSQLQRNEIFFGVLDEHKK